MAKVDSNNHVSKNSWKDAYNSDSFCKKLFPMKELDKSWTIFIKEESKKDYFKKMYKDLKKEFKECIDNNINIYPPIDLIFNVFKLCSLKNINVIILGQDPYINKVHVKQNDKIITKVQAMGLSFSVPIGVTPPPSLKNIYKELVNDPNIDFTNPKHFPIPKEFSHDTNVLSKIENSRRDGDLTRWVKEEGVFLLNCALTVREKKSNSHANYWQQFTENVIKFISNNGDDIVFILWGRFAQSKEKLIDAKKHSIIKTTHPSPLSAHRGFLGSQCFSKCNKLLKDYGKKPINWNL